MIGLRDRTQQRERDEQAETQQRDRDAGGPHDHLLAHRGDGRERFGGLDLGDDGPLEAEHRQRRVGAEHRRLRVVRVHAESGGAFLEHVRGRLRLDRHETDARALGLHGVGETLREARVAHALRVGIDVLRPRGARSSAACRRRPDTR